MLYSQPNQEMASEPSRSETNLTYLIVITIWKWNLQCHPYKPIRYLQPDIQRDTPVDEGMTQSTTFIETRGKRLKAALTIIVKASHYKAFMETCLMRNSPPRNVTVNPSPHLLL